MSSFIDNELKQRLLFISNLCVNSQFHMENKDYMQVSKNMQQMIEILENKVELKDIIYSDWRDKRIEAQKNNE